MLYTRVPIEFCAVVLGCVALEAVDVLDAAVLLVGAVPHGAAVALDTANVHGAAVLLGAVVTNVGVEVQLGQREAVVIANREMRRPRRDR